jgi:hypothetical protein
MSPIRNRELLGEINDRRHSRMRLTALLGATVVRPPCKGHATQTREHGAFVVQDQTSNAFLFARCQIFLDRLQ